MHRMAGPMPTGMGQMPNQRWGSSDGESWEGSGSGEEWGPWDSSLSESGHGDMNKTIEDMATIMAISPMMQSLGKGGQCMVLMAMAGAVCEDSVKDMGM